MAASAFRDRPQEAINVFSELLNQQPERTDVRMELAAAQISLNQPADALATLAPIKKLIGAYRSENDAKVAIERIKSKPGFAKYPDGFEYHSCALGVENSSDGF